MKKLFLSVAALLCATLMFAQDNTTTVTQDGLANESDVVQEQSKNNAVVNQYGAFNKSDIITKGDMNDALC